MDEIGHIPTIPGYAYGSKVLERSPVTLDEFERMERIALFGDDDVLYLRLSHDVLKDQVDDVLGVWYGLMEQSPQLMQSFLRADGQLDAAYVAAVRKRVGRWILDTARAEYDQAWLDWQHEIGLRHHRTRKNLTDGAEASEIVPFRYLFPLIYPMLASLRPFLARGGHSAEVVEKMHAAWMKSTLLQVTLWSHPYLREGDF